MPWSHHTVTCPQGPPARKVGQTVDRPVYGGVTGCGAAVKGSGQPCGGGPMSREELKQWVANSRASQGLPPVVNDKTTLARVVTLIKSGGDKA
ncbi:hypothetical protein GCM10027579_21930 [Calidifontibacter terrae]